MAHRVTLIPGDGTGPELVEAARRVIDASGASIEWEVQEAGADVMEKYGTPLPDSVLDSIRRNRVALKGPITTPIGTGFRSVNVALRHELNLYACVRPCKLYPGVRSRYDQVDLVIVRENTEDLYAGVEFEAGSPEAQTIRSWAPAKIQEDAAISIKPISRSASERIIRYAFEYALANNRRKVTAVAKANIMKYTDGLFFHVGREVAKEYEGRVEYEERLVDNMCMQLVLKPEAYDVLVMPNLYGDILSDVAAGLVGGLGMAPGANIGDGVALFEPTHGSAPKYAGLNKVNPTAIILSGVMMLRHLGEREAADRIEQAVARVIAEGRSVTYDLKADPNDPTAVGTSEMADAIIAAMA
ncbi:isocitrate/isopropylmalate dehydrogenase family protein [Limnochorda pilosa]|uniref:isocitrate/isopropylmalate dehydrogenase family protein n=1 Tax=Limnochorda pilosa TaxID=1555112 RepID=UPI001DCF5141|nr:isocitrate/isopropylmalate dehydrogenase family protein [Limnochorda pilosa]MBO2486735.1 isocitrate dehydrogenase [Bacillota bacterium]